MLSLGSSGGGKVADKPHGEKKQNMHLELTGFGVPFDCCTFPDIVAVDVPVNYTSVYQADVISQILFCTFYSGQIYQNTRTLLLGTDKRLVPGDADHYLFLAIYPYICNA